MEESNLSNQGDVGRDSTFLAEEPPSNNRNPISDPPDTLTENQDSGDKLSTSDNNEKDNPSDLPPPPPARKDENNGDEASKDNWFQVFNKCLHKLQPVFVETAEFLEESMTEMNGILDG